VQALKNGALWSYLGNAKAYKCKSDRTEQLRSYAVSRAMNGQTVYNQSPFVGAAPCVDCQKTDIQPYRDFVQIQKPSSKAVFVDAASRTDYIVGSFYPFTKHPMGSYFWYQADSRNITSRHFKGFNLSYADLSVGHYKYKDKRSIELSKWNIDPYGASSNNKDLENMIRFFSGRK